MRAAWLLLAMIVVGGSLGVVVLARQGAPLRDLRMTGRMTASALRESSAVTRGRGHPEILWTLNDSGNPAEIYAIDTTGAVRAVVTVEGVPNHDWEAMGTLSCGSNICLVIGDVGDNLRQRDHLSLYRIREPSLEATERLAVRIEDSIAVWLPDGARNVEAIAVSSTGIGLFTKEAFRRPRRYWVPASAWGVGHAEARDLGPGFVSGFPGRDRMVTDAALSDDGRRLAIRSYTQVWVFERTAEELIPQRLVAHCRIGAREPIGEGIGWWDERTLVFTSEGGLGRVGPIHIGRCDAP